MSKLLYLIKYRRPGKMRLFLLALLFVSTATANSFILGPFDLDNDEKNELLLVLNQKNGVAIDFIENLPENGFESLWSFSFPQNVSANVTNVQVFDLDMDGHPECLFTVQSLGSTRTSTHPELYVFRGTEKGFSEKALTIDLVSEKGVNARPTGLSIITRNERNYIVVSQGAPGRNLMSFSIELTDRGIEKGDIEILSSDLINTGYRPVYVGKIGAVDTDEVLAISTEDGNLKVALFHTDELGRSGLSLESTLRLPENISGSIFGMGITSFDSDNNGMNELIIPFKNGKVISLDLSSGELLLVEPTLERELLVSSKREDLEKEIEKIFLLEAKRLEEQKNRLNFDELLQNASRIDTLELGQDLYIEMDSDTSGEFYSFVWESRPPDGCAFDPAEGVLEWLPTNKQIGEHVLIYRYAEKLGVEHLISEDTLGDSHLMVPILDEKTIILGVVVQDSIKPVEHRTVVLDDIVSEEPKEADMFTLTLTRPTNDPDKMFVFSGEPPFGVKARELPISTESGSSVVTYAVSGNLAGIHNGSEASFSYKPTTDSIKYSSSLRFVQDMENNLVLITVEPKKDTLHQWIDPENFSADLYSFPHFYFEGFGADLKAAAEAGGLAFRFNENIGPDRIQASVRMQLPSSDPDEIILNIQEGAIGEMSGVVKVRENGAKKIELEFSFYGDIILSSMITRHTDLEKKEDVWPETPPETNDSVSQVELESAVMDTTLQIEATAQDSFEIELEPVPTQPDSVEYHSEPADTTGNE